MEKTTGNCNTGNCNTGDLNTGYRNTGNCNTGDLNTGDLNTGDWNTGYWNTGDLNTGYRNTGNCNTGDLNTGYRNTGNWNTGHHNTGYCNSITPEEILVFNKPAKMTEWRNAKKPIWMKVRLTRWVLEEEMTDAEKESYPSYTTTGGYLKSYSSLKQAYIESWENASDEDRKLTEKLPNFDPEVFAEVFGFNPFMGKGA